MVKTLQDIHKLLLLLKYHGPIDGRTRFQKLVFLLQTKYNINLGYDFIPYFYGPYSKKLQLDIDWLGAHEIINIRMGYQHILAPKGEKLLERSEDETGSEEALKKAVRKLKNTSTKSLIGEAKSLIQQASR